MAEIDDLDVTDDNNTARFPEGLLGGTINNSARALEGILARWYSDTNGSLAASGSSNAFAVTSNRTITSLTNNLGLTFTANHSITAAATLNLNGLGAKSLVRFNGDALVSGDIISGQPVQVLYKSALDQFFVMSALAASTGNMFADFDENAAPGDPAANDARLYAKDDGAGTTVLVYRDSAGTESVVGGIASQTEMEAASSVIKSVAPGGQHHHPGHPKAWGRVNSNGSLVAGSYNVSGSVRNSEGRYTITLAAAMANENYAVLLTPDTTLARLGGYTIQETNEFDVQIRVSADDNFDDVPFSFAVFGDMA